VENLLTIVNFLWTDDHEIFFRNATGKPCVTNVSARAFVGRFARRWPRCMRIQRAPNSHSTAYQRDRRRPSLQKNPSQGRLYHIEVKAVSKDRWSAPSPAVPGMPTALMPFYGPTPDEAARQLSEWLTRAYARAANPANTV
jgi:hypothetical protein